MRFSFLLSILIITYASALPVAEPIDNSDLTRSNTDWRRGNRDWRRGNRDWRRGNRDWRRGNKDWRRSDMDARGNKDWKRDSEWGRETALAEDAALDGRRHSGIDVRGNLENEV